MARVLPEREFWQGRSDHDIMVYARTETGNEMGNENAPNVFFNDGYTESCNRKRTTSQLAMEKICCSGVRLFPPSEFCSKRFFYAGNDPVPEIINRYDSPNKGNKIFNEMIDHCD